MNDSHVHVFPDEVKNNRADYFDDPSFRKLYFSEKSRIADSRDVRNYLSGFLIEKMIVCGFCWQNESRCFQYNESIIRNFGTDEKIIPFAVLPSKPLKYNIVRKYISDCQSDGFQGVGELAFYETGITPEIENYLEVIFDSCSSLGLPVMLHVNEPVGHQYPGKYSPNFEAVYSLIKKYPDLKIILSHWGGGIFIYELMKEVKTAFKNVFYDTAASPFLYNPEIYKIVSDITGGERILFGSDFPLLKADRYLNDLDLSEISDLKRKLILAGNFQKLFPS